MDVHEFHSQIYDNYTRLAPNNNGGGPGRINKLAHYPPEHEDRAHARITPTTNSNAMDAAADLLSSDDSMIRGWHDSSRIFRVSRAFGGKDRHTKVLTSKGLRDRRVRLSVSTAIQFYDLQDRLGYDQPSRAIEWLINAAADSIGELPSLQAPFPETPRQVYHAKLGFESASLADGDTQQQNENKNRSMSKSASSTSETSKTDVRVTQGVKAGERAREREFECEQAVNVGERASPTANPITHPSASSSLTELLTGATGGNQSGSSPNSTPMIDCFTNAGLISSSATARHSLSSYHHACSFLGQTQMGNSVNIPAAFHLTTGDHQQEHDVQHFNSLTGYINRRTLQSNTPSTASPLLHHNLQRYASSMEGSNLPAFFVTTAATSSMGPNQHHFPTGLNGGLNLYCGDEENSDYKGKK